MIKHIVLLNWKEGTSEAQIQAVTEGFAKLPQEIPEIKTYHFGADASIYPGNMHYGLVAEFATQEDLDTYVKHPKHQAFMKDLVAPILESFQSLQFKMDSE